MGRASQYVGRRRTSYFPMRDALITMVKEYRTTVELIGNGFIAYCHIH
jgi:hypothetical protein